MGWKAIPPEEWEPGFEYEFGPEGLEWNEGHTEAVLVLEGLLHEEFVRATLRASAEEWREFDAMWSDEGDPVRQWEAIDQWVGAHMEGMEMLMPWFMEE